MSTFKTPSRRQFVHGAAAGAAVLAMPFAPALAAYPERNINVVVPTSAGGGADQMLRAFTAVWTKYLKTSFEPSFFPGASGRVGYEVFMGKRDADCYNVLFGNMGPELLNWVVQRPTFKLDDYIYFGRVDNDPSVVFVGAKSKFHNIDQVIAEGRKRKLNVGTSRMAHPASIGILALGEHTGAQFNLIPLAGGKNTIAGVVTGEMDFGVLPAGVIVARGEALRTLLVFDKKNVLGAALNNAPAVNDHFKSKLPPLVSSRAFAIHTKAIETYPDRFKVLENTFKQVFADPEYKTSVERLKGVWELIQYGNVADCKEYADGILSLGERYKTLLTGASEKAGKKKS
jgi:tripartite-type tricarboxylate transporter receptor subunit TctC